MEVSHQTDRSVLGEAGGGPGPQTRGVALIMGNVRLGGGVG